MTKPSTEELKKQLEQLVETHNKAIQTIQDCKHAIIATKAVIKDRENGNTDDSNSTDSKD